MLWTVRRRPSLPLALLAALLVSYHQFITDATLLLLPLGTALGAAMQTRTWRAVYVMSLAGFVLVAPALLLLAGARFHLLAIPALALLAVWDGRTVNPEPAVHNELVHDKNETRLAPSTAKLTVTQRLRSVEARECPQRGTLLDLAPVGGRWKAKVYS
jgi:hypothetical protein